MQSYIITLKEAGYVLKTQLNHLLALQKLFAWIEFCINGKAKWPSLYKRRNMKSLLKERREWLDKQVKVLKPEATRESVERNDRISLEERDTWVDLRELIKVYLHPFTSTTILFLLYCVVPHRWSRCYAKRLMALYREYRQAVSQMIRI